MQRNKDFGSILMKIMKSLIFRISIGLLLAGIIFSQIPAASSSAQSPGLTWEAPVNVSQTGGTTLPAMAIDSADLIHVFWNDTFADQGFAQWDGQEWTPSTPAIFDFADVSPQILNDNEGNLFAFWIDPVGALLFSRAIAANSGSANAWSSPLTLADAVSSFSAAIGNNGRLYVAYIIALSSDGTPAGVYARAYNPTSGGWGAMTAIYLSQYFRSLTVSNAHVNVSVSRGTSQDSVFIAWDDTPLKRVYLARSSDEGETWGDPVEIDGPRVGEIPPDPFNIQTLAYDNNLLVLWQTNLQSAFDCAQNYQFSSDLGEAWQPSDVMFEDFVGCPQSLHLFPGPDGLVMLMSTIQESTYLSAWDGLAWSDPQSQQILNSFSDPVSDNLVKLGCLQPVINSQDKLFVVGCDTTGNGDTWVLSRSLGTKLDWFPPDTVWTNPTVFTSTDSSIDQLHMVSDQNNLFHAVWREYSSPPTSQAKDKIFYAQFNGVTWGTPSEIVNIPDKNIGDIYLIYAKDGFLYLVWSGKTQGQLFFAWANAEKASSQFEWSEPVLLPTEGIVTSPSISEGVDGQLMVTYVIPVNENRGVYFIQSTDKGVTWSAPSTIFSASEAGWEMVGQPYFLENTSIQAIAVWTKNSILAGGAAIGLYSSTSLDGGITWSPPQEIDTSPLASIWLQRTGLGILHRLWEGDRIQNPGVWHEVSLDGGNSWIRSAPVSILGETGVATITTDASGHMHIFQSFRSDLGKAGIAHLWWDGSNWQTGEMIQSLSDNELPNQELAAAVDNQGRILLLALNQVVDRATTTTTNELAYSTRIFEAPPVELVPTINTTPPVGAIVPTMPVMTATAELLVTQTATTPTVNFDQNEPPSRNSSLIIGLAVFVSAIFVLGGLFVITRKK